MDKIAIKKIDENILKVIWQIGYTKECPEWSKWNGPYYQSYKKYSTFEEFESSNIAKFMLSSNVRCICLGDEVVGVITRYWEDPITLWLEIGILIYDEKYWGGGIGSYAIKAWTTETFNEFKNIEHIGLTTWSGNVRMMKLAEKVGFKKEAQIRKVRFWQGVYYDSVKYGVLREEWNER